MYNQEVRKASKAGFRHGDVYAVRIDELPKDVKKLNSKLLAEGEATGHHHMLVGDAVALYEQPDSDELIIQVFGDGVKVVHQEHAQVEVDPGVYKVFIQEEHDPFEKAMRRVVD